MGYVGGILCGADKLAIPGGLAARVIPAVAEVLGVEAIASQSTLEPVSSACSPGRVVRSWADCMRGRRTVCPRCVRATRWIWIRGRFCMRMVSRKGWRWSLDPSWVSSPLSPSPPRRTGRGQKELIANYWLRPEEHGVCERGRRVPAPERAILALHIYASA